MPVSPYLGQGYETVGGNIFWHFGLLTFLVDKAPKDKNTHENGFVPIKDFCELISPKNHLFENCSLSNHNKIL